MLSLAPRSTDHPEGSTVVDGRERTGVAVREHDVSILKQSGSMFPHLAVRLDIFVGNAFRLPHDRGSDFPHIACRTSYGEHPLQADKQVDPGRAGPSHPSSSCLELAQHLGLPPRLTSQRGDRKRHRCRRGERWGPPYLHALDRLRQFFSTPAFHKPQLPR
ncbi:hypothetical protein ES703_05086 [subsurface metagenome]